VFRNDDLDLPVQNVDGEAFNLTGLAVWMDPENLAIVKHRFEGTATAEGQSRDFFIELENGDFRNPPGCGEMYEPYRRTMRMGGMLDAAQMAEMEQARVQLAEFEQQLASMPAQQRESVIDNEVSLLMQIQLDLAELGYAPGNTVGVLDLLTQIATSQFQTEQGLEATGEPSAELGRLLSSLVR
jgi:hypothetical protein